MTPEDLQQIQAIIQAAVTPLTTQIKVIETKLSTIETKVEQSEQKILTKLDSLEKLTAGYLDGEVQTVKRRVDHIEKHLNLTP